MTTFITPDPVAAARIAELRALSASASASSLAPAQGPLASIERPSPASLRRSHTLSLPPHIPSSSHP